MQLKIEFTLIVQVNLVQLFHRCNLYRLLTITDNNIVNKYYIFSGKVSPLFIGEF